MDGEAKPFKKMPESGMGLPKAEGCTNKPKSLDCFLLLVTYNIVRIERIDP